MTPFSIAFLVDSVPFTKAVVAGETSLGGSESACLGLARALQARGHDVHIFATKLAEDAEGPDFAHVTWHKSEDFAAMNSFIEWDVVVGLRMYAAFFQPMHARLRILWNQDLMIPGAMPSQVMAAVWNIDQIAYVSQYHRHQWEDLQKDLAPIGWVTKNGYDPSMLPTASTKDPFRIIHVSRPERGLDPILAMWPALKAREPRATLQICRYSSMYDTGPGSWTDTCQSYDRQVQAVNEAVGGITYLGELNKAQLYQAISDAAVMWYPGVASFAETSCIAAIEAQACGTPFVGSFRGALPETVPSGVLVPGDALQSDYQEQSIAAVLNFLHGCQTQSFSYRKTVQAGLAHVKGYTFDGLAGEWEAQIQAWFRARYEGNTPGVLRQLLHEDDHVAARAVAESLGDREASRFCTRVIDGQDQSADDYASHALGNVLKEATNTDRFKAVIPTFEHCTRLLDVACGNGAFAIALAWAYPEIHVHGIDYAQGNIDRARAAAEEAGVSDRVTFERVTVYDYTQHAIHQEFASWTPSQPFDGLHCGEFIEHVANCAALVDGLERVLARGARVLYSCPHGPWTELMARGQPIHRGHVHHFQHDDLKAVFGRKAHCAVNYMVGGMTRRGAPIGVWLTSYTVDGQPARPRSLQSRIERTRPLQRLSVGIIAKDAEQDLARCLNSIYALADEIVVGDTGSTDTTRAIAESYGARVIDLPDVKDIETGFSGARNAVLDTCTGDWFLWIDSDEQLINGVWLRRYLDGVIFNGLVIRQAHLYLDRAPTEDIPVRLFRNTGTVRFYGCVHEQPQDGECNTDIYPTLDAQDLRMAHTGYLTEDIRQEKRVRRNLPLLMRDQQVFADRLLGKVLLLREAVIQSDAICSANGGVVTPRAQAGYAHAIRLFMEHFDDPGHKFHVLARPWYQAALEHLGLGYEMELALAGERGSLGNKRAAPERIRVRDARELDQILRHRMKDIAKQMEPVTFHTDPSFAPVVPVRPATSGVALGSWLEGGMGGGQELSEVAV